MGFDSGSSQALAYSPSLTAAVDELSSASEADARGAVFTRAEVVDFILDLVGYTSDQPLFEKRLLEPSLGDGGTRRVGGAPTLNAQAFPAIL